MYGRGVLFAVVFAAVLFLLACSSSSSGGSSGLATATRSSGGGNPTSTAKHGTPADATNSPQPTSAASSSGTPSSISDPCSLLTQGQVAAAAGREVEPGGTPNNPLACEWTYNDPNDIVGVVRFTLTTNVDISSFTEGDRPGSDGGLTVTDVSGVGDAAYYIDTGIGGVILAFRKGNLAFDASLIAGGNQSASFDNDTAKPIEKTLAQEVLAKF
jgi:hypothetical protein